MPNKKVAVIILAAGKGTRLRPLTEDLPKCLVPVAGVSLLAHMLTSLENLQKKHGLAITVYPVTGFRADAIESFVTGKPKTSLDIRIVPNPDYATTNNLYSLRLAMDAVRKDGYDRILWANGDCIYDEAILEAALTTEPNVILCDSHYPYNEESMKIATDGTRVLGISKSIPAAPGNLVSIDCYAFTPKAWMMFDRFITAYCTGERRNIWAEIALHDFMQEENVKGDGGYPMTPCDIKGLRWAEIDNAKDLAMAESLWTGDGKKQITA